MTLRGHRLGSTATALGAVAVAALSLTPVIYLFASGISLSDIRSEFHYPSTVSALLQTVGLTASVSVLTVAIGVGCALLVARTTVVLPRLLTVLFALPLAVPGFVSSYAAYSAQLLYVPRLDLVTSFTGASLVLALTLYPYVFLPCVVALRTIDPALEEVAASLRPQRLTRLRHVVLPALRPAIAAGVLIVALHVIAEYGAMVQLGQTTLTTKVMAEMLNYGDYQTARSLSWRWDDDGSLVGSFRLPPEQGIRFLHAMEIAKGVAPKVPDEVAQAEIAAALPDSQLASGSAEPPRESDRILTQEKQAEPHRREQRNSADALIDLLERAIAAIEVHADPDVDGIGLPGLGAERFSLVLRAQQDRLGSGFTTDNGVGLHSEVGLRLTCDCSYSVQTEDAAGNPLHLGRKTRRIRGRLARAVHARDGGTCRAPGCNNRTRQIHHIKHWSHGGPTCIENLISLCDRHHWLVHEGGWSITGPQGNWLFSSPTGKVLGTTPPLTEPVTRLPQNKNATARAATSLFGPEPFNLSDAIYVLAQRDDFASGSAEPRGVGDHDW